MAIEFRYIIYVVHRPTIDHTARGLLDGTPALRGDESMKVARVAVFLALGALAGCSDPGGGGQTDAGQGGGAEGLSDAAGLSAPGDAGARTGKDAGKAISLAGGSGTFAGTVTCTGVVKGAGDDGTPVNVSVPVSYTKDSITFTITTGPVLGVSCDNQSFTLPLSLLSSPYTGDFEFLSDGYVPCPSPSDPANMSGGVAVYGVLYENGSLVIEPTYVVPSGDAATDLIGISCAFQLEIQ